MRLGNLVQVRKGKKPASVSHEFVPGYRRLIQIDDLRAGAATKYCPPAQDEVAAFETDVIIAWDGANAGTSSFGLSGVIGSTLAALRPTTPTVFTPYLGHFVRANQAHLRSRCKGATVPHIDGRVLESLEIPLPPFPEQRRIAEVLDKADALRTKRRASLDQLDTLSQSIFLDMFGDPIANRRGWLKKKLSDLGSLDRGVSKRRPRNAPELLGGRYPFVQTGDVANCNGYIRGFSATYSEVGLRQSRMWPAGTLCITIAANIAKTGILTFDACFPDSVVGFRAAEPATVEFVRCWLSFVQASLEDNAPESAQKNINLEVLRNLEVPTPDANLQREFARRVAAIESVKVIGRAALAEADDLFASLQLQAFRGELGDSGCVEMIA
jgi:type I restriction enzyme S subunit